MLELLTNSRQRRDLVDDTGDFPHSFAVNLWISDHDEGASQFDRAGFDRVSKLFSPYFRELGIAQPEYPERMHPRFEDQVEALLEAGPPAFSFVFGIPSADILGQVQEARHRHDRRRHVDRRSDGAR